MRRSTLEQEEGFRLAVEKRAYDVLLSSAPFAFATVRLPWMTRTIQVDWSS